MLESLGYREAPARGEADLILFNTCSIREKADDRFRAHLGEAKRLKREDPERIVGVGGCWAQSVKDEVFAQFPFVDVAFGPGPGAQARRVPHERLDHRAGLLRVRGLHRPPARRGARAEFQAWVQISVGCNMKCSYCIVPSTRGPGGLPAAGGARRRGRAASPPTASARSRCSARTSTPTARELRPRALVRRAAARARRDRRPRPHPVHEPASQGHGRGRRPRARGAAERVRARASAAAGGLQPRPEGMRRTYDRERYIDRVALLREHVPDCAITTDIIVGFPGETEEDFQETLEVCEEVGFDGAFTFIFSPRRGTEAAEMADARPARGEGGADGAARRGRPAACARARAALRGADARRARRGPVAHGPVAACAAARATTRS